MGSTFLRRLKFYGIGFGLGLIFVVFFFQNRGCAWLPGNRVKNTILDRVLVISEETANVFQAKGLTKKDAIAALNDGSVLFGESDKRNDSKVYVIEHEGHKFLFTLPYESFITEVKLGGNALKTKTSNEGYGIVWRFPKDPNLVFIDSTELLGCQQKAISVKDGRSLFSAFKKSARIDFKRTDLAIRPKPEHYIIFKKDTNEIVAKTIWYKDKLEVLSFEIPFEVKCP
jgi:hypothetical protein